MVEVRQMNVWNAALEFRLKKRKIRKKADVTLRYKGAVKMSGIRANVLAERTPSGVNKGGTANNFFVPG